MGASACDETCCAAASRRELRGLTRLSACPPRTVLAARCSHPSVGALGTAQVRGGRAPAEGSIVMATTRGRLSDVERAERRRQDRERLQRAAEQLLTSEGWRRWVRVRSQAGLARLSLSNQLLIALARPDATFVAGFKAWLRMGYCVRKAERGIAIIAPLPLKERDRVSGEETGETLVLFKTVFVFDRAQVAPIDGVEQAPLQAPCEPLTGDTHRHLIGPMRAFAESLGFSVSFQRIDGPSGGWCDPNAKRIVVDAQASANARLRTLIHETIHGLGVGYREYGRERAEVIVDTATLLACSSVGLDISGETVPYVAGWGEDGALEAVSQFARTIDELARRIESVLSEPRTSGLLRLDRRSAVADLALLAVGERELGLEGGVVLAQPLVLVAQRLAVRWRSDASLARSRAGTSRGSGRGRAAARSRRAAPGWV